MTTAPSRNDRLRVLKADNEAFSHSLSLSRGKIEKEMSTKWRPTERLRRKPLDSEIADKIREGNNKMSEYLYTLANEPSIGLFHVNSHVRQTVPRLVELRKDFTSKISTVEALNYDMDDTIITIQRLSAIDSFKNILFSINKSLSATESLNRRKKFNSVEPYPITSYNFPKPKSFDGEEKDSYIADNTSSDTTMRIDPDSYTPQTVQVDSENKSPIEDPNKDSNVTDNTIEQSSNVSISENKDITINNDETKPIEVNEFKSTDEIEPIKEDKSPEINSSPTENSPRSPFKGNMQFEIKGRSKKKKGTKKKNNTLTPKNF